MLNAQSGAGAISGMKMLLKAVSREFFNTIGA
jgi:hypothetical protein